MMRPAGSLIVAVALLPACATGTMHWPTPEEMRAFEAAGPIEPELDVSQLLNGLPQSGPYRVVPSDLLEIRGAGGFMVAVPGLGAGAGTDVVQARVQDDGTISLPLIGALQVARPAGDQGMMLTEIEHAIADALCPRFLKDRPAIVVKVLEPARVQVAVHGAVERPGVVALAANEMNLFGALSAAGGIIKASNLKVGARVIRVRRPGAAPEQAIALPVKGLNVPFANLALKGGETIEVARWDPDLFTVVGLVTKPGAYEYAPGQRINLMQALAVAGGVDRVADPPYATVFRKDAADRVLGVTFEICGNGLVQASGVEIRPGDVIAVEHTAGSWTRSLIATVFRAQVNFFVDPLNTR